MFHVHLRKRWSPLFWGEMPYRYKLGLTGPLYHLKFVKVAQLCLTLCDPMGYTVHGILQARILEWVTFPFFRESSQPRDQTQVSHIAGGFFTSWATREALVKGRLLTKVLKWDELFSGERYSESEKDSVWGRFSIAGFEDGRGHKPRNMGSF